MKIKTKRGLIFIAIFILFIALVLSNYFFSNFYYFFTEFILAVCFLLAFHFLDHFLNIQFELKHYLYVMLILFAGILFSPIYYIYYSYDKVLHFVIPVLWCIVVYYLVDKLRISFWSKLLFTFSIVVSSLVFLEIIEYSLDTIFGHTFQGVYLTADFHTLERMDLILSKIDDTMIDLIFGVGGSLLFVIGKSLSYFYKRRYSKKPRILRQL